MARFGLSPYSNPVESALQSFGTGLRDISLLRDLTSGNKEREEQQSRQLTDLQITGQQQRNQENQENYERTKADRAKADDIDELTQPVHRYRMAQAQWKLQAADAQANGKEPPPPPEPDGDAVAAGLAVMKMHGKNIHDAMPMFHSYIQLAQHAPVVEDAITKAVQSGQTQGRISDPELIKHVNGAQLFGKDPITDILFDASDPKNVTVTPVGPGEGNTPPQPMKDKDGNIIKVPYAELKGQTHQMAMGGTTMVGIGAYLDSLKDPKALEEFEAQADKLKTSTEQKMKASKVLDEYGAWEKKQSGDISTSDRKQELDRRLLDAGIDKDTRKELIATQVKDKANPRSGLAGKETIVDGKRVYLDDQGDPTDIVAAPKERPPVDPVTGEIRQQRLDDMRDKKERQKKEDHAKLVKEKAGIIQKTDDGKTMSDDEVQEEAERLASAQESGTKPGKSPKKTESERLKPLKDKVKDAEDSGFEVPLIGQVRGTDMDYLVKSAAESGNYSDQDLKKVFTGDRGKKALEKYNSSKATSLKTRQLPAQGSSDMPPAGQHSGKILRDNQTGKRYKSDGKKWNEIA